MRDRRRHTHPHNSPSLPPSLPPSKPSLPALTELGPRVVVRASGCGFSPVRGGRGGVGECLLPLQSLKCCSLLLYIELLSNSHELFSHARDVQRRFCPYAPSLCYISITSSMSRCARQRLFSSNVNAVAGSLAITCRCELTVGTRGVKIQQET